MKIELVFETWEKDGVQVHDTELRMGDFHGGTVFSGSIDLDEEQEAELQEALKNGFEPVFWLCPPS